VLHSRAAGIAFAHYPKTAGHALVEWFRATFPDAAFVEPDPVHPISHLPVRESLVRLGAVPRGGRILGRAGRAAVGRIAAIAGRIGPAPKWRVIGVVREPFEMLVSLFEYWRDYPFATEPDSTLIRAARSGSFGVFLDRAVVRGELPKYENFFDVGGPVWASTRLLDFADLDLALARVGEEWGFTVPAAGLARRNVGPRPTRDLGPYRAAAGPLLLAVERRFAWYRRQGAGILVRGTRSAPRRVA